MKNISDIMFIIQARLNSERVPQKMIRPFAGTTLVEICIDKLISSKIIPRNNLFFSVHENELIDLGNRKGINIFKRSEDSITDQGQTLQRIYEWYKHFSHKYYVLVSACHPLLKIDTIESFINSFLKSENDGMFAVVKRNTYYWNKNHEMLNEWPAGKLLDTKLVDPIYEAGHCLYAGLMEKIGRGLHMGTFSKKGDPDLYIIENALEAWDIDELWQFEVAEILYKNGYIC